MSFNFLTDMAINSSLDIVMVAVALLPRLESGAAVGMFEGNVVCGVVDVFAKCDDAKL